MKKSIVAIMMAVTLVGSSLAFPVQAYAQENVGDGEEVEEIYQGATVTTNNGTVTNNNGTVTYNRGTVTNNNGTITINYEGATVTTNNGTVTYNNGEVTSPSLAERLRQTADQALPASASEVLVHTLTSSWRLNSP